MKKILIITTYILFSYSNNLLTAMEYGDWIARKTIMREDLTGECFHADYPNNGIITTFEELHESDTEGELSDEAPSPLIQAQSLMCTICSLMYQPGIKFACCYNCQNFICIECLENRVSDQDGNIQKFICPICEANNI